MLWGVGFFLRCVCCFRLCDYLVWRGFGFGWWLVDGL